VPIIIVAHSMGGIVFEKAYTQGHEDPGYYNIVSNIKAILFISTPHSGNDYAETLKNILSASLLYDHVP